MEDNKVSKILAGVFFGGAMIGLVGTISGTKGYQEGYEAARINEIRQMDLNEDGQARDLVVTQKDGTMVPFIYIGDPSYTSRTDFVRADSIRDLAIKSETSEANKTYSNIVERMKEKY